MMSEPKLETSAYVIGGLPAPEGRFPYVCALFDGRDFMCGGTLIDPYWVLTAAHCVDKGSRKAAHNPVVYCGAYSNITEYDGDQATASRQSYYPIKFNGDHENGFDIALVELREPFDLPLPQLNFGVYCEFEVGQQFSAVGWGYEYSNSGRHAETLQHAPMLDFVPRKNCNAEGVYNGIVAEQQICAGSGGQDTCQGDSGSPLFIPDRVNGDFEQGDPTKDVIVGLVSYGPKECGHGPGVYTSISAFEKWIIKRTGKKSLRKHIGDCMEKPTSPSPSPSSSPPTSPSSSPPPGGPCIPGQEDLLEEHRSQSNEDRLLAMEQAIRLDNVELIQVLLCLDVSVQANISSGISLLHFAVELNAQKSVAVLIEEGADVDLQDEDGNTPLQYSCHYGFLESTQILLNNGANPDSQNVEGFAPLHRACFSGYIQIVKALIAFDADVNVQTNEKQTPLFYSARRGDYEIVQLLIEAGADPSLKDTFNRTPLDVTCTANIRCTPTDKQKTEQYLA